MEVGILSKKGFRSLLIVYVLVLWCFNTIEANVYLSWYHSPDTDRETIKTAIAREIIGKTVRDEWDTWRKKGVFIEGNTNGEKEITFSTTSKKTLGTIFGYLNYFPLLEKRPVIFNIPVDGQNIKLKLVPFKDGTFKATHLYTDPSGQQKQTRLSNSKEIVNELIVNTNDHPELRKAIEEAIPRILNQQTKDTGTFVQELQKATLGTSATIPNDIQEKAFRNALEVMLSTSVLRKSTDSWIAVAQKKVKEQTSNLVNVELSTQIEEQWKHWKQLKQFDEKPSTNNKPKQVLFKSPLSISPNEIFYALRYFGQLETETVQYSFSMDSIPFTLELAPKGPRGWQEFTATMIYTDNTNKVQRKDISDFSYLRKKIDKDVLHTDHGVLQSILKSSYFSRIFKFSEARNPQNVFENALKTVTKQLIKMPSKLVQERVLRNAVGLIAGSILLKKPIPELYWMHSVYEHIKSDVENEEHKIKWKATERAIKKHWNEMKNNNLFTESNTDPKEIVFDNNADITVKDIFDHLRHFTALESQTVIYKLQIDGQDVKLKLAPDGKGSFNAKYLYEDALTGKTLETDLLDPEKIINDLMETTHNEKDLSRVLESTFPEIFKQKLAQKGKFENELRANNVLNLNDDLKQKARRQTLEAMASLSLLGREARTWIDRMDEQLNTKREAVEGIITQKVLNIKETTLKYELAASMAENINEVKEKWQHLQDLGYVETTVDSNGIVDKIKINKDIPYNLKDTLRFLQRFHDLYPNHRHTKAEVIIPMGGEDRTFYLSIGTRGKNQLLIGSRDIDWPDSTKTPGKKPNHLIATGYKEMLERGLRSFDSKTLAETMLAAINSRLDDQPDFSQKLKGYAQTKTGDVVRATVEFILITMIAEASNPPSNVRDKYISELAGFINRKQKFPTGQEMPHLNKLQELVNQVLVNIKEGRSPTADLLTIKLLELIAESGMVFERAFNERVFPFMKVNGGTAAGRNHLHEEGNRRIAAAKILEEAAGEHDGQTLAKRARLSCTVRPKRKRSSRRRREACSLEEVDDHMMVDDKSIKVEDDKVQLDLVDRRDASKRKHLVIPISSDDLATPQLIKQDIANSKRDSESSAYAKINKGLAVHGLIFSAIGAIDYFQRGDNVRGGIAVSQSLHTLGGLTGFNEIASKAAKQVLRHAAVKVARGLNMEKGLEKFSLKVEKYMEKGVGRLMGDLPGVGLVFDIYFIEQDIEALSNLDLNNPEDVKMLPLRVVDLVLDVDTTVLNLIGTFCPAAEVVTEPLIIVLSIVRMAIDDFYVDIMEEMDKVNWNSPWAGFEAIGALFKGIVNGAADFLSGGLRRQMENYSKQEKADKQLISSLKDATSYYKITGKKGEKTIDFTQGKLSSFGGFITFRMCDDGMAHLEIGDVTGNHETVTKSLKIDHDVKDIVLGIGESREFLYEKKTAKLWAFIPVKHYKVIKNAKLKSSSLFGTYYGNNKDNKFFAVQNQKKSKKQNDKYQCDYGKIDIGFVTGHYHYNLFGHGGNDSFYLGPQMSKVAGGKGNDVYFVQSYGGNTIIDNFSEDNKRDMVIVNVPYDDISCRRANIDLDILYRNTHHIRITNWFVPGNPKYYRHVAFKSKDGILFISKDVGNGAECTAIAIAKGGEKHGQNIFTDIKKFSNVKQVVGSDHNDKIYGNDLNNILDGGKGVDYLVGGRNEDTYIIRAGEGCDIIDNYADDYKKTTDVVIFNVKYENILLKTNGQNLTVFDSTDADSCVQVLNWIKGVEYRHMIFTSKDHVVFKVKETNNQYIKFPMILDYSSSNKGVRIDLNHPPLRGYTHHKGFDEVATVTDSKHSDHIKGNKQSNFLSCTGGSDVLYGGPGSDNYVVKKSCELATIINLDPKEKVDLLLIDYRFQELNLSTHDDYSLVINYDVIYPKVILSQWYTNSAFRHLWVRTSDGMTLRINDDKKTLEPVEISKDPEECLCKGKNCQRQHIKYDLSKHPWTTVTRFQLKSSLCNYNIRGNDLNNYIDPGSGNSYSYQHLRGGNGADTYVLKHGYGEFNVINNLASDNKSDILRLGLEIDDIKFSFYGEHDVILASKAKPKSLTVRIKNYFKSPEFQHLKVITVDEVTFEIKKEYPFMKVLSMDLSRFDSPQDLTSNEMLLSSKAQSVKGTDNYPNKIFGTSFTKEIEGGFKDDILIGGSGNNIIRGRHGNDELYGKDGDDILYGGDGDDYIEGGNGNDYIYGGDGKDKIDGGPGGDTICFKGDGFEKKGVYVDLTGGFGKGEDAEGDTYTSIEHVYGTIHDDVIIGSDSDNNLHGLNGSDVVIARGGHDHLDGGDGKDRYILDDAYGIKTIDNYATDQEKDTLSLTNTYSDDVCIFLIGNDLHLQIKQKSLTSLLYQKMPLSVIVLNWNKSYKHRHLNILFKDTFWPSHALGKWRHLIDQKTNVVQQTEKNSKFAFTSGTDFVLSWKPYQQSFLDNQTQMEILQFDVNNPRDSQKLEIPKEAISNGNFTITKFSRNKHYIFALLLKYCSSIVASSYSLTYFGEKRSCKAINIPHSQTTYTPKGSYAHQSQATLSCSSGYKFKSSNKTELIVVCLDGTWQPKLPLCIAKANCPQLTKPEHGKVFFKTTTEEAVATYICDKGFRLVGSMQRHCSKQGQWTSEEPKCERINCFQLPNVKHGKLKQCNGNSISYGTMKSPKHGFCVKLTCNTNYLEHWKLMKHDREFEKMLPENFKSRWFCRGSAWEGVGDLACFPAIRLTQNTSTWHEDNGVLQEWDNINSQWKNSFSTDTKKHRLACANTVGVENYNEKPRILISDSRKLRIACPKIRFGIKITTFEGKLETLIEGRWHSTCLIGPDTNRRLATVYQHMCTEIGLSSDKPGISMNNHGPTSHVLTCSKESSDINMCDVEKYSMADCTSLLQCKRRCNDVYPVANAKTKCNGEYEGSACKVECKFGFRLIGPRVVYCRNGVWSTEKGAVAVSRCEQDKFTMMKKVRKKLLSFGIFGPLGFGIPFG